ncbi:Zn-dependent exopeptidase [Polychaeton citri CBS 116435]|uniref:Peptide hydrolase n=1 Tax=Polychaeton citri CBS 116435 TaxID=1314669 RepID=A0A9P4Q8W4_9PEZI|nr:Zn-dependent exopeptidase [Polychaeton citri CBS 116435]
MVALTSLLLLVGTVAAHNGQHNGGSPSYSKPGYNRPTQGPSRPWKSKEPWKGQPPWKTSSRSSSLPATAPSSSYKPTGTATLPLVNSEELQASISESALSDLAHELEDIAFSTDESNRVMGSLGHNRTIDWITSQFDELKGYFTYEVQPFAALYSHAEGNLTVNDVDQNGVPFEYTAGGDVAGEIVMVEDFGCEASNYPANVDGKIALISRGTCEFGLKSALAGAAGATGAIIYNNAPGEIGGGTLGEPPRPEGPYVPTIGISQERGVAIADSIEAGETVSAGLLVDAETYNITTYNVIAQTIGGDDSQVLTMGAHSDSVYAGPGINDDGSGTVALLEVARQLTKYRTNNAVRFCFWSGEEFGLLGSTYYVSQLSNASRAQIPIYLNFDMIASPNYIYAIFDGDGSEFNITGPPGSAEGEAFFQDYFTQQGLNYTATAFDGRSDYGPFIDVGIAAAGLFTGAEEEKTEEWAQQFGGTAGESLDPNYHDAGDNYDNLNFEAFVVNTKAIAAAVAEYGTSFGSLNQASLQRKRSPWKRTVRNYKIRCHHKIWKS